MANTTITGLTEITSPASTDVVPIVDLTGGSTKKVTIANLVTSSGVAVTASSTTTLTNKTINLTSNTLTGTTAQFNTALSDGDFATLAGTETLTNKTISASQISSGTFKSTTGSPVYVYNKTDYPATFSNAAGDYLFQFQASGTNALGIAAQTSSTTAFLNTNNGYALALGYSGTTRLKIDGSNITLTTPGTAAGSAVSIDATQTLTNKTLTSPTINTPTIGTMNMNNTDIQNIRLAEFNGEVDNGNSGTADTIDWGTGNFQKSTLTGNCTYTFTAPSGPARLTLKIIQDATGSRTVTWPASVKWSGGTAPTLTTTASRIDFVTFWYDGTSYFGSSILNYN